jgi:hypothetical protein
MESRYASEDARKALRLRYGGQSLDIPYQVNMAGMRRAVRAAT